MMNLDTVTHCPNETFSISVDSCESMPKIQATFEHIPANRIKDVIRVAEQAFRSVEVTSEETGEICYNAYCREEWYSPIFNYGEALDTMCHYAYDEK